MKERPILFSAPMVRAILDGSKTQTRRVVKQDREGLLDCEPTPAWDAFWQCVACPYGQPGDRLWVREAWAKGWTYGGARRCVFYRATLDGLQGDAETGINHDPKLGASPPNSIRWRPSIHMPRWASRILLEIVSVRVERLQDISEDDARAEGIERGKDFPGWYRGPLDGDGAGLAEAGRHFKIPTAFPKLAFRALWESINGAGSWAANPWVWVVEFRRVETTEGE